MEGSSLSGESEGLIYVTRRAEFSASHYYCNPHWTAEENQRVFGKCSNPLGHGHNYTVEVTVRGAVNPATGMVLDLKELKALLDREVIQPMDHKFLNKEVSAFAEKNPTTENLAIEIWTRLAPKLSTGKLHRIRVYETADLYADYYGE